MFEIMNTIATSIGWGFLGLVVSILIWKIYIRIVFVISRLLKKGKDE